MEFIYFDESWLEFNTLPGESNLTGRIYLPRMDGYLYSHLKKLSRLRKNERIVHAICKITQLIIDRLESGEYMVREAESVFNFLCQIARFNGFFFEEYAKRDNVLLFLYHLCSNIQTFEEDFNKGDKIDEVRNIIRAVIDRPAVIQEFCAKMMDFKFENIFLAKLLKSQALKKYFLDALEYIETIPGEELIDDKRFLLDCILESLGNPGWDDFTPVLRKYLYLEDEILLFTVMDSLGKIGGESAVRVLKDFRFSILEGFRDLDHFDKIALDLNIIAAQEGYRGLIREIKKPSANIINAHIALRLLSSYKEPEVISFLYQLLDDERHQEAEVHYIGKDESFIQNEIHFPLREGALLLLQNFDEDSVVSVVGEKYRYKKDYFYKDLAILYQKKGLEKYWDDDED